MKASEPGRREVRMNKAVFLIGVMCKNPSPQFPLTDVDLELLGNIADEAKLDVEIVFAVSNPKFAGAEKKVRAPNIKAERARVVSEIQAAQPEYVFAFGRTAMASLLNTGTSVLKKYRRKTTYIDDIPCPVHVCDSLSRVYVTPGIRKWLRLDVLAAVAGFNDTIYGEHKLLLPGTPEWEVMPDEFQQVEAIGFDLETYPGTNPWVPDSHIRMAILSAMEGTATVVQTGSGGCLPEWVSQILVDPTILKGGSDISFDCQWIRRFGGLVENVHDTVMAEHIIDCTDPNKNLKYLTLRYAPQLGDYARPFEETRKKYGGWAGTPDEEFYLYAGGDGEASIAAMLAQNKIIEADPKLTQAWKLADDLYPVLIDMRCAGLCIDKGVNDLLNRQMSAHLEDLVLGIQETLGPINPRSSTQMAKALVEFVPGIDLRERTWVRVLSDAEDEDVSTQRVVLEREADKHPVIGLVLEHRRWAKLHGTYVKALRDKFLVHHGGRDFIHPKLAMSTETYRLAGSEPSPHQIPRKPKEGDSETLNVKRQFISRFEGGLILNADYAQMEMRIAAQESSDSSLLNAISEGDVHLNTASMMFRQDAGTITEDMRTAAKTIGFATLYGAGKGRISKLLGISQREAEGLIGQYFRVYPTLRQYIYDTYAYVMQHLSVTTPFGFTRTFMRPAHGNWEGFEGARIKRQGFNTIIQSTAACVMYVALIEMRERLSLFNSQLICTVHDSVMIDCPPGELEVVSRLISGVMSNPDTKKYGYELTVPLAVDLEAGNSWGTLEKIV